MSSNNLSIEDYGSLDISSDVLSNKETQTSSTYITDSFDLVKGPSRPLPKGIDKTEVEPPITNILDCRILKDPSDSKSTDLETDSFVKEIVNLNPNLNIDELDDSLTSFNYCKDVAQPYLNTNLSDCEDHVESLEKLIQDALEDFPDYQPCYEVYDGQKDIQDKISEGSANKMDSIPTKLDNENTQDDNPTTKIVHEETDNAPILKPVPTHVDIVKPDSHPDEVHLHEDDTNVQNKNKELNRSISMESVTQCIKDSLTVLKRTASSCLDKIEFVIGIKKPENPDDKPTYYAMEKPKSDNSPSHNVQTEIGNSLNSLKNLLNNPSEKIATFTDACKDACNACKGFAENLNNNASEKISAMKDTYKGFAENLNNNANETICAIKDSCKGFAENLNNNANEKICAMKDSCKGFAENLNNNANEKICAMKDSCKGFAENLNNTASEKICAMKDSCKGFAENLLSNPDEKINTIKKSCCDYADKLYASSKDAVTLLTTESVKFLSKSKTDLNSDNIANENQPKQKEKILRSPINADSITSFLFKKAETKPVDDDPSKEKAITGGTSRITDAIPPAVKLGFNKLKDDLVTARFEKSSPYDKTLPKDAVTTKPPEPPETRIPTVSAIDHTPDPPPAANVFEIIRSKIFSLFRDEGQMSNEPAIQENQNDDEEEDPFERFMEQ